MQENIADSRPIRVLILELVKEGLATHTKEIVLNVMNIRHEIKSHSVRAVGGGEKGTKSGGSGPSEPRSNLRGASQNSLRTCYEA